MVDVTVTRVMDASRAQVYELAGDPSNAPRWYSNIRSARWRGAPGVRPGARRRPPPDLTGDTRT